MLGTKDKIWLVTSCVKWSVSTKRNGIGADGDCMIERSVRVEGCGDGERGQDLQWASVSEKSRDVKRIVTSPLGKSENGCMIVVLRPTKVRYG